jgi:predicted CopG family antitoxin
MKKENKKSISDLIKEYFKKHPIWNLLKRSLNN